MAAPPQLVVQIADTGGVVCEGYYDLPVTVPGYIALVTDGSALAAAEARRLQDELRGQVLRLPGARLERVALPCDGTRGDFDCKAIDRTQSRNVVIFVGGGRGGPPASPKVVLPHHNCTVLVLLPKGAAVPHIPWSFPTNNVGFWTTHATEHLPRIFAAAGLTEPDARVFISYKREDTRDLADQLFEALGKRHYDVFVDRFRIAVGADFEQRILQELAHKSMAVFIESRRILASEWTKYEIAVAKSSRIGVLALHIQSDGTKIPDIDDSRRMGITLTNGTLDSTALDAVIDRITSEHSQSQMRRRRLLRENMQRALRRAGIHRQSLSDGMIEVEPTRGSPKRYLIWLPSRPAELADFHFAATTAASAAATRTIVAPAAHLVGVERERMRWLTTVAAVRSFDEGHMLQVAKAMKAKAL